MSKSTMKAAVYHRYGDILESAEVEKPSPADGEVLVEIRAASVNAYDWHLLEARPFFTRAMSGLFKPKNNILGADIAGVVASVGAGSERFKVGDEVFGCLEGCGEGGLAAGGFAESVCAKEGNLALRVIPMTDQDDYDRLLWFCDLNFVRGEDSFLRAQWAARPFVWQIYPQKEDAHLPKLD